MLNRRHALISTYFLFLARRDIIPNKLLPLQSISHKRFTPFVRDVQAWKQKQSHEEWTAASNEAKWLWDHSKSIPSQRMAFYSQMVQDRLFRAKPLQFILGTEYFGPLELEVLPPVLIPRWETAEWCSWLIEQIKIVDRPMKILDIGTGSGCIALLLAHQLPSAQVVGIDRNPEAIQLAKRNQEKHKINNVQFLQLDLKDARNYFKKKRFDMVVSNPPYIPADRYEQCPKSVKDWEDIGALVAESEGTAVHESIIKLSKQLLVPGGASPLPSIVMEIDGAHQKDKITGLVKSRGYQSSFHFDSNQKCRWVGVYI